MKRFFRLMLWELEENWRFPVLEIVIAIAIFAWFSGPTLYSRPSSYEGLVITLGSSLVFLFFVVSALFSMSLAGVFRSGEIQVLLSYPVKRWEVFLSKFATNFLIIFTIFSASAISYSYISFLTISQGVLYVVLAVFFFQLFFLCSCCTFISVFIKSEVVSVLLSLLLFFGIQFSLGTLGPPYKYLAPSQGVFVMVNYINSIVSSINPYYSFSDFIVAMTFPTLSALLLVIAFAYFRWMMEVD